jgi:hypothetical protein
LHHSQIAFSPLPSRLAIVFTCTVNLPCRLRPHMCTKPKKLKVDRLPHGLGRRGHWVDMLGVD